MSSSEWTPTTSALPPEGASVEVITPGGDQRPLVFSRGLWFLPDKSMYCYFTPTFWRVTA